MEKPYQLFTYGSTIPLEQGMLVEVPFGKTTRIGCVWESGSSWDGAVKGIIAVLQPSFWHENDITFLRFCRQYYHAPLQEVLQAALPSVLRRSTPKKSEPLINLPAASQRAIILNEEQQRAVAGLQWGRFYRYYLYGITGSGKTRCYAAWIQQALKSGNVLLMIPEIHLSHQMTAVLEQELGAPIVPYHSQLTPKKRTAVFHLARGESQGVVFLTTRSGIFLPIRSLSLIIVDEEHDPSYKQAEGHFRYHARDLALKKAQILSCPCVLGSATPSVKFLEPLREQKNDSSWGSAFLTQRATGYPLPQVEIVMGPLPTHQEPLAFNILQQIRDCLRAGQQVLIYINQRGYAPKLFCPSCRKTATCPTCLTSLTMHQQEDNIIWICHHCLKHYSPNHECEKCHVPFVVLGFGTQRLAEYLQEIFMGTPVMILDTDHLKNSVQVQQCFDRVKKSEAAILIGTQMISKGHDWPNLHLVILLVAAHHLKDQLTPTIAQQILQTAGRAGRHQEGRVLLPVSYQESLDAALEPLLEQDYLHFLEKWQKGRDDLLECSAKFLFQARDLERTMKPLRAFFSKYHVWGPCLDYPYRRGDFWRFYGLLRAPDRKTRAANVNKILQALQANPLFQKSFLSVEIDPLD